MYSLLYLPYAADAIAAQNDIRITIGGFEPMATMDTMTKWTPQKLTITALLIAIGILIPMVMPIKLVIEPASFTLASHVAIFIAVLLAPDAAIAVVIGTTAGFFIGGFPPVIVLRAASHIVFAIIASIYVKRQPEIINKPVKFQMFNLGIGVIHAACEVAVVAFYYIFIAGMEAAADTLTFRFLFMLIGVGGVIHSFVDFNIAYVVFRTLRRVPGITSSFRA
jgi:niacin transporter